jgi:hypothetical protein
MSRRFKFKWRRGNHDGIHKPTGVNTKKPQLLRICALCPVTHKESQQAMASVSATGLRLERERKTQEVFDYAADRVESVIPAEAGESITFNQNRRSRSVGTTGHVQTESAVRLARNTAWAFMPVCLIGACQ